MGSVWGRSGGDPRRDGTATRAVRAPSVDEDVNGVNDVARARDDVEWGSRERASASGQATRAAMRAVKARGGT